MKKLSILIAICVLSLTSTTFGQKFTQHVSFDDQVGTANAGTYNSTDHFSVDLYLTYSGYTASGLSLWFQTTANAAPNIFISQFTWDTTFTDRGNANLASYPMGFTLLESNGMYTNPNPSDFGAIVKDVHNGLVPAGTYLIGNLSVSLSGLAAGVYVLQTDATSPHGSEVSRFTGDTFVDEFLPVSTYTITIIPEPSTFALLIVMAIGAGLGSTRARFRKRSYS
jgi:hypothetical protein